MDFDQPSTIRVSCAHGLAPHTARELEQLGCPPQRTDRTGVECAGTLHDAMRLNLHLRTALHVLYTLKSFRCGSPDELYRATRRIAWDEIIAPDGYLTVNSFVDHPSINNTMFANVRVKDAIVDRVAERCGRRPDSGPRGNGVVVNLFWKGSRAILYLNASGDKLADRGYRRIPHGAPLQETLAAAILIATGYDGTQPLVLPMCGSGALAIEAALLALNRAPGLLRAKYAIMHVLGFDADAYKTLRIATQKQGRKTLEQPIIATDIDPTAVEAARKNATTAGVDHLIRFDVCDFAQTPLPDEPGIIVLNPGYGRRMGEIRALEQTYTRIGDFFKQRCPGWTGFVFTGNLDLAKKVGLRTSRRVPFFNADIECRLLAYELYQGTRKQKNANAPG
jgi:putative N6-adenine-specific DNA methylase